MKTTKKRTTKKKGDTPKSSRDIPLDNIPEKTYTSYPVELKQAAVARVNKGEPAEAVARSLGISNGGVIQKWVQLVRDGLPLAQRGGLRPGAFGKGPKVSDFMNDIRVATARANTARNDRLEIAAYIVESDCTDAKIGAEVAKKIRTMKRVIAPTS